MSGDLWRAEPFGATWYDVPSASEGLPFSFQSLGDRVRGRLFPSRTGGAQRLVLVAGPSGRAADDWTDAAARAWSDWACVASIDLPLCGARESEKLSGLVRGETTAKTERLQNELRAQTRHDLARAAELISTRHESAEGFAFVGVGIGARLGAGIEEHGAIAAVLDTTASSSGPDAGWLERTAAALQKGLAG